ncbi:MAG: arsenate reductase ArsC, partial [Candidatus Thermoplasmatota archaeon]|nr:arsenate reductase ArsC [Candidatus Thermoplasmatota archaeon]
EGLLRNMYGENYKVFSAGVNPTYVNQYAIDVMKEIGIDISKQPSKSIEEFRDITFDYVVTVCDNAKETCPFFPGKKILHKGFEDPVSFNVSSEETLAFFRKVRDEIKTWIAENFA